MQEHASSINVTDADWYRAVTLAERLPISREFVIERSELESNDRIERQLQRWCSTFDGNETLFEQRLNMDSLSMDDLRHLLSESAEGVRDCLNSVPPWLEELNQAFSRSLSENEETLLEGLESLQPSSGRTEESNRANNVSEGTKQRKGGLLEFLYLAEPLISLGCKRLHEGIQVLCQTQTTVPFDPTTVTDVLLTSLMPRLITVLSRTLVLEFNVARLRGLLKGDTPDARYQSFGQRLRQQEVAIALLKEYPVLARYIVICINQWVEHSLEFLRHLCMDWNTIRSTFSPQKDPGILKQVEAGVGDVHKDGQSVMILSLTSGLRFVYKPRSMAIDVHFQELLRWLNERGEHPQFKTLNVLDRGNYGWAEFVEAYSCTSHQEVQRFYTRQGAYLALLHMLKATDFHHENLIAAGEHPILIDIESLFHPYVENAILQGTAETLAGDALLSSVIRVMLLPQLMHINNEAEGIEMSGLGGAPGQLSPGRTLLLEGLNTEELRFIRKRVEMPGSRNRPMLNNEDIDVQGYAAYLVTGFTDMYRLLLKHRDAFLSSDNPLVRFANDEVRVIVRPTFLYARLLQESFHPDMLRNALDRDFLFDHLWLGVHSRPLLAKVISAERVDLQRGDIPIFTTRINSCDLWTSFDERLPNFFDTSGLDLVLTGLQKFSEEDLEKQLWFIRASLTALSIGIEEARWPDYSSTKPKIKADRKHLLAAAQAIGKRLEERALHGDNDTTWIGLTLLGERNWVLTPAGMDLYSGLPGIAFFLAYLGKIVGEEHYTTLARAALATLRGQLERVRSQVAPVGAFNGWGSVIYTFTHLAVLWNDPKLLLEAEAVVELLPPLIEKDDALDIISGSAGCIGSLISLYYYAPSERIVSTMIQCGERLIATAQPMEQGVGWITTNKDSQPLTGFSHGAAGIAWALLKLARYTGQQRFRTTALEALAYERSLYSSQAKNWPDVRDFVIKRNTSNELTFMTMWCHGAPGIGLGRIDLLEELDDTITRAEIEIALETTLAKGFGLNHSLCHGDLGNIELLLQADKVFDSPRWHSEVTNLATHILSSIDEHGWICGVPLGVETPGLMLGLAGIGYSLLRLADPVKVPAVLLLSPPTIA